MCAAPGQKSKAAPAFFADTALLFSLLLVLRHFDKRSDKVGVRRFSKNRPRPCVLRVIYYMQLAAAAGGFPEALAVVGRDERIVAAVNEAYRNRVAVQGVYGGGILHAVAVHKAQRGVHTRLKKAYPVRLKYCAY